MASLEEQLKQAAHTLGFDLVGIAPAAEADGFDLLQAWLEYHAAARKDWDAIPQETKSQTCAQTRWSADSWIRRNSSR